MFRIIKLMISVAALAAFVWFGMNVKLGEATLFSHIQAIWESEESQNLVEGTRQKVDEVSKDVTGMLGERAIKGQGSPSESTSDDASESGRAEKSERSDETLTDEDREALGKLIRSARK